MDIYSISRAYKELRSEYLCLKETLNEFENDCYDEEDVFISNGLSGFRDMLSERTSELKAKMSFIEGMMFGLSLENQNKLDLPKAIDK